MQDDYQPQRLNHFVDIPEVSDTTVQAMLADLKAAGKVSGNTEWPEDPE
jgi:cell division FtsZ-interacting protein ZapD